MLIWTLLGGLVAGSAASAIGDRLVDGRDWRSARSACDNCQHRLEWRELIPLLSWLWQRGRCRWCQKPIAWRYPLLEVAGAGLWGAVWLWWPLTTGGFDIVWLIGWLIATSVFLILTVADYRWLILPTSAIMFLFVLGLLLQSASAIWVDGSPGGLMNAALGMLVGAGPFYLLYAISPKLIGFGDVRLGAALGVWLGSAQLMGWALAVGSWIGLALGLGWLIVKKRRGADADRRIPFGPSLMLGAVVVWLGSNWLAGQNLI